MKVKIWEQNSTLSRILSTDYKSYHGVYTRTLKLPGLKASEYEHDEWNQLHGYIFNNSKFQIFFKAYQKYDDLTRKDDEEREKILQQKRQQGNI